MTTVEAEEALKRWVQSFRSFHPDEWNLLRNHLGDLMVAYRDRAIDGTVDNGLTIGFARGVTRVYRLVAQEEAQT